MRRTTLTLSLALGCLMTTQSFGFDLLDRMMGNQGCGCDTACCETPDFAAGPACGCEAPSCDTGCGPAGGGLLSGLRGGCAAEPACGCEPTCDIVAGPACGCDVPSCDSGCGQQRGGLLSRLFGHHRSSGCDTGCCEAPCAEPACGCEPSCAIAAGPACGCDSGCGSPRRGGLLSRLFSGHRSSDCCDMGCDSGCGCGTPAGVPAGIPYSSPSIHSVPEAPAPIVDPSASIQSKRRVVQASARYVR